MTPKEWNEVGDVVKGLIPHPERWECCSRGSDPMTGGLSTRKVKVRCTLPAHPGHGQGGPWGQWGSALLHQTADKVHVTKCSKKLKKQIITWYSSPTFRYIHRRIESWISKRYWCIRLLCSPHRQASHQLGSPPMEHQSALNWKEIQHMPQHGWTLRTSINLS